MIRKKEMQNLTFCIPGTYRFRIQAAQPINHIEILFTSSFFQLHRIGGR